MTKKRFLIVVAIVIAVVAIFIYAKSAFGIAAGNGIYYSQKNSGYYLQFKDDKTFVVAYNPKKDINYDETFTPVSRMDAIRLLLAYASTMNFKLFQMDVKSAFLNGLINEEIYVEQPSGFTDSLNPQHVYKLKKTLYGLK